MKKVIIHTIACYAAIFINFANATQMFEQKTLQISEAVKQNNKQFGEFLKKHKFNSITDKGVHKMNVLHFAIKDNDSKMLEILLNMHNEISPVLMESTENYERCCKFICAKTPAQFAAKEGRKKMLLSLQNEIFSIAYAELQKFKIEDCCTIVSINRNLRQLKEVEDICLKGAVDSYYLSQLNLIHKLSKAQELFASFRPENTLKELYILTKDLQFCLENERKDIAREIFRKGQLDWINMLRKKYKVENGYRITRDSYDEEVYLYDYEAVVTHHHREYDYSDPIYRDATDEELIKKIEDGDI